MYEDTVTQNLPYTRLDLNNKVDLNHGDMSGAGRQLYQNVLAARLDNTTTTTTTTHAGATTTTTTTYAVQGQGGGRGRGGPGQGAGDGRGDGAGQGRPGQGCGGDGDDADPPAAPAPASNETAPCTNPRCLMSPSVKPLDAAIIRQMLTE